MHEPSRRRRSGRRAARRGGVASPSSRPTGTPSIVSIAAEVRLHQHAERVAAEPRGQHARRGADAALPAEARVPVPAPTEPSATGPPRRRAIAASTCSRVTCWPRMSFRPPSLVSPTSAFTERTSLVARLGQRVGRRRPPRPRRRRACWSARSASRSCPSSSTCVEPASLPNALPTNTPPATLSWNRLPACGTIAVTPVRTRVALDQRRRGRRARRRRR